MKKLAKKIYSLIPAWFLLNSKLKRYIHNKPIPKSVQYFEIHPTSVKFLSDASPIARLAFWVGINGYESTELKLFERLCSRVKSVCEIGGNIGYFTVFGATSNNNRYEVFEPLPYNYELLKRNVELNNLGFVKVHNSAVVGNRNEKSVRLNIPALEDYGAATGGFIQGAESINRDIGNHFEVNAVASESILNDFELLKIDVEGAEYEILSNAEKNLARSQTIILVEMRRGTVNLRKWIRSYAIRHEYHLYALNEFEKKIVEVDIDVVYDIILQDTYGTRDIIMCPKLKKSMVTGLL